jgi:dipeptidyl aminopeptidase/acylaminoacyl peptidase
VSPLSFAAQLKVPMLVGHGEENERVPPSQSRQLVDALN